MLKHGIINLDRTQIRVIVLMPFLILLRFLDSVPVAAIEYFRESAEKLIAEKGAVEALAAALAHISGAKSLEQRSLLNSDSVSLHATHNVQICIKKRMSLFVELLSQ